VVSVGFGGCGFGGCGFGGGPAAGGTITPVWSENPPHNHQIFFSPSPFSSLLIINHTSHRPPPTMPPRSSSKTYKVPRRPFESARLYV
jgi:hypothetical protein